VLDQGVDAYFSLCPGPISLADAVERASELLADSTAQAFRAFLAGSRYHRPS
jgi:glycerate kinase